MDFLVSCLVMTAFFKVLSCQEEKPLELHDIIDKKYDKMRPPKPEGRSTMVSFHVTVMSLDTIDEGSMTYAADVFFAQEWRDHRLTLPDNMTTEYRLLPVTFQTMTIPNHYVWLYKDKRILYMVKLTLLLSCAMHFENYPHDEQECNLSMESLSHTTDDLVFVWLPEEDVPLAVDPGIELPQLELVSNLTGDCTSVYSTGNFTCLEVIFKFRRRLGYYLFHTYIPTCLIVMMSWISFWIKPEAVPARVTLGVTSLLTLSTQHANSQKSLPPVSYIKAIDIFMSSCTVFVFLSLIEYAFVNVMMGDISEVERKDKTAQLKNAIVTHHTASLLPRTIADDDKMGEAAAAAAEEEPNVPEVLEKIFEGMEMCPKHGKCGSKSKKCAKKDPKEIMKTRRERAICIDKVSRVIFPSTFILLNIIYWLVFSDIIEAIKSTAANVNS